MTYMVYNVRSGQEFGLYEADSETGAIDALHKDAGYDSPADLPEGMEWYSDDLRAREATRDEIAEWAREEYGVRLGTHIADDAAEHGYLPRLLATNGKTGDAQLAVWECDGVRVVDRNADPIWEESDPEGFAAEAAECGL